MIETHKNTDNSNRKFGWFFLKNREVPYVEPTPMIIGNLRSLFIAFFIPRTSTSYFCSIILVQRFRDSLV